MCLGSKGGLSVTRLARTLHSSVKHIGCKIWRIVISKKETTRMERFSVAPTLTSSLGRLSLQSTLTGVNSYRPSMTGKMPSLSPRGPFHLCVHLGMELTIKMIVKSLTTRGQIKRHIQFGTVQKLHSTFTKLYKSSPVRVAGGSSFVEGTG